MDFLSSFLKNDKSTPNADEIEVSLFGAGIGECIVIHSGNGCWHIVDSLINPDSRNPVAQDYLDALGISTNAVKRICATHWHDDHVRGISTLATKYSAARVVISTALGTENFGALLRLQESHMKVLSAVDSGLNEFSKLFKVIEASGNTGMWAGPNSVLFEDKSNGGVEIRSLSPSDLEVKRSFESFARLMPEKPGLPKRAIPKCDQNDTAIVLWIKAADINLLLGSDLENPSSSENRGWNAILELRSGRGELAHYFKVPHHGSDNAHHPEVWGKLLVKNAISAVTPFSPSKRPRLADVSRILESTSELYSAGELRRLPPEKLDPTVEKMVKETLINRVSTQSKLGLARTRIKIGNGAGQKTELFGCSAKLQSGDGFQ